MRIRPLTAPTTLAVTALLLGGCGGSGPLDDKDGPAVADAAADALEKAGAVHMSGNFEEDGGEGEVDLHLQGEDAIGSITMNGVELELLSADGAVYLKGAADFWTSFGMPAEGAAMFEDRWVIVPEQGAGQFQQFSLAGIVDLFRNPESEIDGDVSPEEADGKDVVVVTQEDGSKLTVANEDPTYPLSIASEEDGGKLEFSRFGEKEEIVAPDDAIDLTEMMGGA
jgi:hypothetical protein